jgi:hypothetical protein
MLSIGKSHSPLALSLIKVALAIKSMNDLDLGYQIG